MQASETRTGDLWTAGLVNCPLLFENGKPVFRVGSSGKPIKATNPSLRFLLFELDTLDNDAFQKVHEVYSKYEIPYLAHRSMRGWHFLSVKSIPKELYWQAIREIKPLNPECPLITIRVKPNKWVNEAQLFKQVIIEPFNYLHNADNELREFARLLRYQMLGLMATKYKVVRYAIDCPKCHSKLKRLSTYYCTNPLCGWRME